jgi:hypothetical protein
MPCRCDYQEDETLDKQVRKQNKKELDRLTRVSCDMRTIIRREGLMPELTQEARAWVKEHDKADAKRVIEEEARGVRQKVKQDALAKLTLEERRALGL